MRPEVAIVGAGYVGMPLAHAFADAGKGVVLIDVDPDVVDGINRGESHIGDVPSGELKQLVDDVGIHVDQNDTSPGVGECVSERHADVTGPDDCDLRPHSAQGY